MVILSVVLQFSLFDFFFYNGDILKEGGSKIEYCNTNR